MTTTTLDRPELACPSCGTTIKVPDVSGCRCTGCGTELAIFEETPPRYRVEPAAVPYFCMRCGDEVTNAAALHCMKCGGLLDTPPVRKFDCEVSTDATKTRPADEFDGYTT